MLSKKRSRPIVFNTHQYRWSVAEDGEFATIAVQRSTIDGQKLEVIVRAISWQVDTGVAAFRPITPALVSQIMAKAMDCGWEPGQRHPPLELSLNESDELLVRRGLPNNSGH